jgi:hypothetical protein
LSYVPKPPPAKPATLTNAWKKQVKTFARYFLVLFRPWNFVGLQGSLPGSLTWRSFGEFIRKLEDGSDGSGPSFLDVVRMRWIINTGQGFRTSGNDRAAVQMFGRRDATVWGVGDGTSLPLETRERTEYEKNEENDEDSAALAQLTIDVLRAEAATGEQMRKPYSKEDQYLVATLTALTSIIGSAENPEVLTPLPLDEAN